MTWKYLRIYLHEKGISYAEYLQTDHWENIRKRFWASKLHKGCCYVCGGKTRLHVHHRSYRRIGREKLSDFCLLCEACHSKTHELDRTRRKGCLWGAAKRLRKNMANGIE